jgi:hypothetical protein
LSGFGERFLARPDLFPARGSGEPWGEAAVVLDLAGGPYSFEGLSLAQRDALIARFGPLVVEDPAAFPTILFQAPADDFVWFEVRGWHTTFDLDPEPDRLRLAGRGFLGLVSWAAPRGALFTSLAEPGHFLGALENYLRVLVAYRVLERGGALLHSAGLLLEGDAFVLVGRSGAGKSTLARMTLEQGGDILSDELNALWPDADGVLVERMPFAGDLGQVCRPRSRHPLRGLGLLTQAPRDELRPISPGALVAGLLAASPFVNADPHRETALLDNLTALALRAGAFELLFTLGLRVEQTVAGGILTR